jgi:hypothetical protein
VKGGRLSLLLLPALASAHVISMSNGFATLNGNRVEYILRMPAYEVPQGTEPRSLLDKIRFTSGFESARRLDGECHLDADAATWICAANYTFALPVEKLGVDCRFYEATVPNHIHMLHAEKGDKYDQAILDSAFPTATLAFRPPTPLEVAVDQATAGAMRVWTNPAQVLLLIALALAARTRREWAILTAVFLAGECLGTIALLRASWQPSLRFAEAAAALALAYLALEMLAFPKSGGRWILALCFGAFQGMFFALFVTQSGYRIDRVLSGAALAALLIAAAAAGAVTLAGRIRFLRIGAHWALLATGAIWFAMRLRS